MLLQLTNSLIRQGVRAGLLVALSGIWVAASAQTAVEPKADQVLKAMAEYIVSVPAMSVDYDVDHDHLTQSGEKLQFSAWGKLEFKRPDGLRVERHGGIADLEMYFDGKAVTLHGKRLNVYGEVEAKGGIDDAILSLRSAIGGEFPGGDLLSPDVYNALMSDVESGAYWGTTYVEGVECHYLAFRNKDVDWQIWVEIGAKPLPRKLVITSKWVSGAPQYALRMRNWNVDPKFDAARFSFVPPAGATKLNELTAEMVGDLTARK